MNKVKKWFGAICLALACVLCFSFAACSSGKTDVTVTMNPVTLELYVGETEKLTATAEPKISGETMSWSSSDEDVATVSASGRVTARSVGTATVTASYGGSEATCTVTVKDITVTISQTQAELDFINNRTLQLSATDSENKGGYVWSSSNETVATVDKNGLVTAQGGGTAEISAAIGSVKATCTVKVNVPEGFYKLTNAQNAEVFANPGHWYYYNSKNNSQNIGGYFDGTNAVLEVNATASTQYYLRYQPVMDGYKDGDAFDALCTVTSTQAGWLRVGGAEGEQELVPIEANKPTQITFASRTYKTGSPLSLALLDAEKQDAYAAGNYTLTCSEITVRAGLKISSKKETLTGVGSTVALAIENSDETVIWASSDEAVATVSQDGVVTAVGSGTAVITATVGDKTAKCNITVVTKSIELSSSTVMLNVGDEPYVLTATVSDGSSVEWTSSDDSVVSVDKEGKVTAVGAGTAVVTATTVGEDSVSAECNVIVVSSDCKITYTVGDGTTSLGGGSNGPGSWYKAGSYGTVTMKDGVVTVTASSLYDFGDDEQIRYMPCAPGEDDFYIGTFVMIYTVTNNTDRDMTTTANINGQTTPSRTTIAAGESVTVSYTITVTAEESGKQLNIKLKGYGEGTVTVSDIYMMPVS